MLIPGNSAQNRHALANGLIAVTRQYDPSLREPRQRWWLLPDEEAPRSSADLISECQ
jgi:hypothetical protein